MKTGKPSVSAISVAMLRAAHLHLFDGPTIHEDTHALEISGAKDVDRLRSILERRNMPDLRRVSAYFALRHRFSEDRLRAALDRGVTQVVLLGAGLDTFALRHPEVVRNVRFVEVDHPDSQRFKLDQLSTLGLTTPGVEYLPIDFSVQDLAQELTTAGLRRETPTFFAWLGVSQYISEAASFGTLGFDQLAEDDLAISEAARKSSAEFSESWISFYRPSELAARLLAMGFDRVFTLTPEKASHYYRGQPASVAPLGAWQLIAAIR